MPRSANAGQPIPAASALHLPMRNPARDPHQARPPATRSSGTSTATRPLLIVEDDAGLRLMLRIALEDAGYALAFAGNGAEALALMANTRPRLILLDMRMPVMDGAAFLQQLYAQPPEHIPPIIVMTAYRELDSSVAQLNLPVLTKPMNLDQLLAMVAQLAEPDV